MRPRLRVLTVSYHSLITSVNGRPLTASSSSFKQALVQGFVLGPAGGSSMLRTGLKASCSRAAFRVGLVRTWETFDAQIRRDAYGAQPEL